MFERRSVAYSAFPTLKPVVRFAGGDVSLIEQCPTTTADWSEYNSRPGVGK